MKIKTPRHKLAMTMLLPQVLLALGLGSALAQINPADPTLRLWLKADGLTGTNVPVWLDSSSHGLAFASPEPLPPVDTANDLLDRHVPVLTDIDNNGKQFKAVTFRQGFDPVTPPPNGHFADRLWQTNKLDATDPTLIQTSEDMTLILVYRNAAPNVFVGPHQAILAKRGPGACPIWLGLDGTRPSHEVIVYAAQLFWPSSLLIPEAAEWGIVIQNLKADGTLTYTEYYTSKGGWNSNTTTGVPRNAPEEGVPFTIASHAQRAGADAGNPYGNGLSERFAGDIAEIALYNRSLTSTELANLQLALLGKYFLNAGPPVIQSHPQAVEVNQYEAATFNVAIDGTPPFTFQWMKGGSPISGATANSYTITNANPSDAGFYSVAVTNTAGGTISDAAFLTVIPDTIAPTVTSALLGYADNTQVLVTFSELVNSASATNKANYTINNSVTVNDVVAVTQTNNLVFSNYVFAVTLTTTPITVQSKLTVNGVQDRAGLATANSEKDILVPIAPGTPPAANRLLWLAADSGVSADDFGVYLWADQSGAANVHHAEFTSFGNAQVGQAAFPNGLHPVVVFDGKSVMAVRNQPDFNIQTLTAYVVGAVDTSKPSRDWIGNWEGWTLGTSDGTLGAVKWVTHTTAGDFSMDSPSVLGNMVPAYMAGTFANPGSKTLSINGRLIATQAETAPIVYTTARGLAIGALFDDTTTQPLLGNVAEVLIYSSVSAAQDAAVQQYIGAKYFSPSSVPLALVSATNDVANTVRVRFSEAVDTATATNAASYTINGATVSAATWANYREVLLTTSALNPQQAYTLTVTGVKSWAGNTLAPNAQAPIGVPAPVSIPISIVREANGSISLTWAGTGWKLLSAATLEGTWTEVVGAASPYPVTAEGQSKFYRLMQ